MSLQIDILESKIEKLEEHVENLYDFVFFLSNALLSHLQRHDGAAKVIEEYHTQLKKSHDSKP